MKTCGVQGCTGKLLARGMCSKHYQRWKKAQDPERYAEYVRRFAKKHRERRLAQARVRYAANPEKMREQARRGQVKARYGLTLEEYEAIIARGCAICGNHGPRMALDHDHANGQIRDALCVSCNNGLGRFYDKPELLRAAAEYIEKHT